MGCVWLWDCVGTIPSGEASQCFLYHVGRCKSCSLGFPVVCWRGKHLCSPTAFPMCLLVPCPTTIFLCQKLLFRPGFGMEKHQDRQRLLLVPCNRGSRTRVLCWLQQGASIASATPGPAHTRPAVLNLKLVLSLGSQCRKPQPFISLPLTRGCVELSEISPSSFLPPQNWG